MQRDLKVALVLVAVFVTCTAHETGDEGVPVPVKQDPEEATMESAQALFKNTVEKAQDDFSRLRRFGDALRKHAPAVEVAGEIENTGAEKANETIQRAAEEIRSNIAAIKQAGVTGNLSSISSLVENSRDAAKNLRKAGEVQSRSMREAWEERQKSEKKEAAILADKAIKSTRLAKAASRALERAQRKAGVGEGFYEQEWDRHEQQAEQWHDEAQNLRDSIQDRVEDYYGQLESRVERAADAAVDDAEHMSERLMQELKLVSKSVLAGEIRNPGPTGRSSFEVRRDQAESIPSPSLFFGAGVLSVVAASAVSFSLGLRVRRGVTASPLLG